jgi:hypothetical protein
MGIKELLFNIEKEVDDLEDKIETEHPFSSIDWKDIVVSLYDIEIKVSMLKEEVFMEKYNRYNKELYEKETT